MRSSRRSAPAGWARSIAPRDTKLNRDVAIKVLPDVLRERSRPARPVPARSADARGAEPSEHRAYLRPRGVGRRHARSSWSWSRARICSQRIARGADPARRSAADREADRRGARSGARAGDHPPRSEAREHQGPTGRHGEGARLRPREGMAMEPGAGRRVRPDGRVAVADDHDARDDDRRRHDSRHRGVHGPEQARGKAVDKRADIWAFGCVCLRDADRPARVSAATTVSDVLASVLKTEPNWQALPATRLPAAIRRLLRRCLEKDPRRRLQAIGDARLEIEDALQGGPAEEPLVAPPARKVPLLVWIVPTIILAVVGATAAVFWPKPVERSSVPDRDSPSAGRRPARQRKQSAVAPSGPLARWPATRIHRDGTRR